MEMSWIRPLFGLLAVLARRPADAHREGARGGVAGGVGGRAGDLQRMGGRAEAVGCGPNAIADFGVAASVSKGSMLSHTIAMRYGKPLTLTLD